MDHLKKKKEGNDVIVDPNPTKKENKLLVLVICLAFLSSSVAFLLVGLFLSPYILGTSGYVPNYNAEWLAKVEAQVKEHHQPPIWHGRGEMQMAWQTPIYKVNLGQISKINIVDFNTKLATMILHEYHQLLSHNSEKFVKSGSQARGANQAFYDWQMKEGWNLFAEKKEIKTLLEKFQDVTDDFLRAVGKDQEFIDKRGREIQAWATVHEGCISHPPHSHPRQLVSGVYYVKMPRNSGSIIFDDPRGPLPPFDNRIYIKPRQGDLVLFPSWLIHQVEPTEGEEERISIPFNIEGDWEATTGLSITFPVE